MTRLRRGLIVALTVSLGIGLWMASPAAGQGGRLDITEQTASVPADGIFAAHLSWDGPRSDDLVVSATIFAPIDDVSDLTAEPSSAVNRYPQTDAAQSLNTLPTDADGNVIFEIPVRSFRGDDPRVLLQDEGVYPVTIEIRQPEGPIASVRTHLIRLPTETAELPQLPVAVVLNVAPADGLEIREVIGILVRHPSLPITVVLEDGVLSQLSSDPELAVELAAALGDRSITAIPRLGLDPSALAAIDQGDLFQTAIELTDAELALVGLDGDPTLLAIDAAVTEGGAQLLGELGVETIIDTRSEARQGTIAQGVVSSANDTNTRVAIVEGDADLMSQIEFGTGSVRRAHRLLATLQLQSTTVSTPIVFGGPETRLADLEALEIVLTALDQPGSIEPVTLDDAIGRAPLLPLRLAEGPEQLLVSVAGDVATIRDDLATYEQFHISGGVAPATYERNLLASLSQGRNPDDRADDLVRVRDDLAASLNVVSLPTGQSITLAARRLPIPLSIRNDGLGDRNVLLRFTSDRVTVDEHDTIVAIPPGTSAIDINVEALSLGVSPLDVQVLTPDGRVELARTRFQIRSTAVPGLGYVLFGAALVFLIAWWIVSLTKARAVASHPSSRSSGSEAADDDDTTSGDDRRERRDDDDRRSPTGVV